jgi:hypothetical protein
MLRITRSQRAHECRCSLNFAHRHGMNPDGPGGEPQLREAEPLRQAVAIGRIAQPAQGGCYESQRRDDV